MTDLDFESSQLQLLTDALRAGPGTPEWRAAIASVGSTTGDEYKALYEARERLASGRAYREVRAGAGFTRKLFDGIEHEESAAANKPGSANLIAAISALVILGILAIIAYFAISRGQTSAAPDLSQTYFVTPISQLTFGSDLGTDWSTFGTLSVDADELALRIGVGRRHDGGTRQAKQSILRADEDRDASALRRQFH